MKPLTTIRRLPLLLGLVVAAPLTGQDYHIDWFKLAGGGGTCTSAAYSLDGTLGQLDASPVLTSETYALTGGFWVLPGLIQTAGAPRLYIAGEAPGLARLWWTPDTPGFRLQFSSTISPAAWMDAPSGSANPVVVPATSPARFYRLYKP